MPSATAVLIASASAAFSGSSSPSDADAVTSLPGWEGALPSSMYSGFLEITATKRLHYVLVEKIEDGSGGGGGGGADAAGDADIPLVLWLNGGPGCSSLEGFFYEHGPLVVADAHAPPNINFDGSGSTNGNTTGLVSNPWAWAKASHVLYLEAPAGVGFSFSTAPSGGDYNTGDNQTAADNLAALNAFFVKFPRLAPNPFYVSGESYGGVYVPTLSLKIYESGSAFGGNMAGYLVGNGVFDEEQAAPTQVPFAYGHGMISTNMYNEITKECHGDYMKPSKKCQGLLDGIDDMYIDTNGYDVYRTCYQPPSSRTSSPAARPKSPVGLNAMLKAYRSAAHDGSRAAMRQMLKEAVPCINSVRGTAYLNTAAVRAALHVEDSPNTWAICGGVNYTDDGVYSSMVAVHKKMLKYSPKVLVYNGDVDPGCNYLWAEASVASFGLDLKTKWGPWVYTDALVGEQLGGFATDYVGGVTFATVHGAGHMSPQWRPEAVFNMVSRFLAGKSLRK